MVHVFSCDILPFQVVLITLSKGRQDYLTSFVDWLHSVSRLLIQVEFVLISFSLLILSLAMFRNLFVVCIFYTD